MLELEDVSEQGGIQHRHCVLKLDFLQISKKVFLSIDFFSIAHVALLGINKLIILKIFFFFFLPLNRTAHLSSSPFA